jgi:antitoxin (DNA-binding transcriptional repressor) of toxin-antitoxin stability system
MKRTSVSEAKSHFSRFLNDVQRGETVLIFDRKRLVARLEPARSADISDSERIKTLVQSGVASAPRHALDINVFLKRPRPKLSKGASGAASVGTDRGSR